MTIEKNIKSEAIQLLSHLEKGNSVDYWFNCRKNLLQAIIFDDLENFLNWKVIRDTMYVERTSYSHIEYGRLQETNSYFLNYLNDNLIGGAKQSFCTSTPTCDNIIHMAYHLNEYENITQKEIKNNKVILEFGGGYGCMAKFVNSFHKECKYVIFDFPEFNLLQKYYLIKNGITISTDINNINPGEVYLSSSFDEIYSFKNFDLLIATWSLSESPIEFRKSFISNINTKNLLIALQKSFDDIESFEHIDNGNFFDSYTNENKNYKWSTYKINHLYGEQFYLFGNSL